MSRLIAYLESQSSKRVRRSTAAKQLDKTIHMRSQAIGTSIAMTGKVDLESNTKGQASRVDLAKLAKAEAKLKAKIEKRSRRDLYQGSKLMEAHLKQQSYEEMFMKVNPLDLSGAAKGKSKDIHLTNIDVSFASNRILAGATLTMAHGRRYGLIGRNGVGKSTLLRHLALREVAIPSHISVLYVEQEIIGDDTTAIESVLQADVWRHKLIGEEKDLNAQLESLDGGEGNEAEKDEITARLGEVQKTLLEMEAETGPARAALLLAGLGFAESDQKLPTRSFSGGWRMRLALARALFVKPDVSLCECANVAPHARRTVQHVGSQCHCMAGRLPPVVAWNYPGGFARPSIPRLCRDGYHPSTFSAARLFQRQLYAILRYKDGAAKESKERVRGAVGLPTTSPSVYRPVAI